MSETATETTVETGAEGTGDAAKAAGTTADTSKTGQGAENGAQGGTDGGDGNPEGADKLGDAGKKALDTMKAERKAARDEAARVKREFEEFKAKTEGREAELKAEQDKQKVRDDALAAANTRILKSEIRAAAAGKLSDPKDALKFVDLADFEVDDDGNVDEAAIASAIDKLLKEKPYLAAQGKRFEGGADGGTRAGGTKPSQLTREDVQKLSREGNHAEIAKAKAEGRLNKLLGITT